MNNNVMLSICGKQNYLDQDPEVIELVTEGLLQRSGDGWIITYEESDLTGLAGVTTTFQVEPGKITLTRKGPLNSQMVFEPGVYHDSLYQMEFGALMMAVCAQKLSYNMGPEGGTVDLVYSIEIEQSVAGMVEYHLEVQMRE